MPTQRPDQSGSVRFRIGTVSGDPLRMEGLISLLSPIAELLPMSPADVLRDTELTMVVIDATDQILPLMAAYRRARPGLRLLVFGESDDPTYVGQVVAAGAKGYLSHLASAEEITMAVQIIADGSIWAPRKVLASLIDTYSPGEPASSAPVRFTPRERELLQLLVAGHSNREIAHRMNLSPRTVQNMVSRLLVKVGVANRVALTVRVVERMLLG